MNLIQKILRHPKGRTGAICLGLVVLAAVLAPWLTPYHLDGYDIANSLAKPSLAHPLGTDQNGIDILTQMLYGARISLVIGLSTGISVTLLGAALGIIAGFFGKFSAGLILSLINVLLVIPTTPLMMLLRNVSSSYLMMIAVFTGLGWCGTARMVRAQVLSMRNRNDIRAAELAGASKFYIMFRHMMPGISHLLIMNGALSCAGFMIAEAGLSFIGLGDPAIISWGKILVAAQENAFTSNLWAWVIAPGAAITITVLGFMNIGAALEEIFNPKIKHRTIHTPDPAELEAVFASIREIPQTEALSLKAQHTASVSKGEI